MKRSLLPLLIMLASLTACRQVAPAPPAGPEATILPLVSQPTTTAPTLPTTAPALPATDLPQQPTAQASPLDTSLEDHAIYTSGLVASERNVPQDLPGAPVYRMDIAIADSMTVVEGQQSVTYTNQEDVALDEICFHLHSITLGGTTAVTDVTVDGTSVDAVVADALLCVPLPAPLSPGKTTTLAMRFETTVPTEIGRNYGVLAYHDDILALAHFYPMLAVYDDEGWNITPPDVQGDLTYSDAGFYLVRVTAPADVVLVGSGVTVAEGSDGHRQTVTYALGPARDFYLAAGDFKVISDIVGETTINSYAPAGLAGGARLALDTASAALATFSRQLGPYPYTELDIVTTPTSALGIEYPGLIVGTVDMYDVDRVTRDGRPFSDILESTTVHEVAHQWFYNLVGNDQLDEPWLDEALASYYAYRYYLSLHGQEAADNYFGMFYDRFAGVPDVKPIGLPVAAYQANEYSASVYGRGPVFVRTLEETMGREAFDAFLRDYSGRYRWQNVDTEAFRSLAETHCGCDLSALFNEWVYK